MPKTPRMPLGLKGLNTDVPSHALPLEFFNAGSNMRPFNGALSGVNSFASESSIDFSVDGDTGHDLPDGIYDAAQFTPAGSSYYNILALIKDGNEVYEILAYSSDSATDPTEVSVSDFTMTLAAAKSLAKDETLSQTGSSATAKVRYSTTNSTTVKLYAMQNSFTTGSGNLSGTVSGALNTHPTAVVNETGGVAITLGYNTEFGTDMFVFNECLIFNSGTHKPLYLASQGSKLGIIDNWPADVTIGSTTEKLYTPKIAQFGGRLVALGLFGESPSTNIYNERASIIFSSPITVMGSLEGIEWTVASTNSTVDDVITESPGAIVDGGQLGDNFIVYKSDMVLSYREVTSSPYIIGRVIQTEDGMISPRCFADIGGNRHIVFGNHGVYIHNGDYQKQIVSKGKIQDSLYDDIDRRETLYMSLNSHASVTIGQTLTQPSTGATGVVAGPGNNDRNLQLHTVTGTFGTGGSAHNLHLSGSSIGAFPTKYNNATSRANQSFVFRHEQDKETWFCIPLSTSPGEGCHRAYVYAEETDSWYIRSLNNYTHIFTTELAGVVRIFATSPTNDKLQELSSTAMVSGGTVEFLNNPLETSAITKTITEAYPLCNGAVKIGLTSTDNLGTSASVTTKDFNPANDSRMNFRETGRYFDMKIEMNGTTNPELTGMEFEVKPRGKR